MADDYYSKIYDNKHDSVNRFLQQKKSMGRSDRTLNEYSRILKRFYHEHFPDLTPAETEVRHVEDYLLELESRDLTQNSKRRYVESLSAFFDYAMKRPQFEDINGNPAGVVLEELSRKVRERPDCATWENARAIVHEIADPRDKAVAVLLAKTGCRVSEALAVTIDDLMLDDGFVRLRRRKGGKQGVVPVDDEVVKTVRRLQTIRKDENSRYLFVTIRGTRVGRERIRQAIREAAVEQNIMEEGETRFHSKFTPHTFRTVFTTTMRRNGMDDRILRYIRGDSEDRTVDIYTKVDRLEAREQYLDCIQSLGL